MLPKLIICFDIHVEQNFGISNLDILNFRFYRTLARPQLMQIHIHTATFHRARL